MNVEKTILGLMSGSSLDGVDMAIVKFVGDSKGNVQSWNLITGKTQPYPEHIIDKLKAATSLSGSMLWQLDAQMGLIFGQMINTFLDVNNTSVDFISSHGHTIFHYPEYRTTCQIGSGAHLAQATRLPSLVDFRSNDVAAGGQGAPLAPLVDKILFDDFQYFLNLGGIANLSVFNSKTESAYDICPCNQLLNYFAFKLGLDYDAGGKQAALGNMQTDVIQFLDEWPYYDKTGPKSLDNTEVKNLILALDEKFNYHAADMLCSSVEHMAIKVAHAFLAHKNESGSIFTTGGGAYNSYLINRTQYHLGSRFQFYLPPTAIIDFKEAILMSLAGWRRLFNLPIFDKKWTGAEVSSTGGAWYHPSCV